MKKITFKTISKYLYDQLTGNFIGFVIGASATGLVSQFFETRSIKNLWGITAKKTVIDKQTFQNLEWIISIIIGFIVFEFMTKIVKVELEERLPAYKRVLFRWIVRENVRPKLKSAGVSVSRRGSLFYASVHHGVIQAFNRLSKK